MKLIKMNAEMQIKSKYRKIIVRRLTLYYIVIFWIVKKMKSNKLKDAMQINGQKRNVIIILLNTGLKINFYA